MNAAIQAVVFAFFLLTASIAQAELFVLGAENAAGPWGRGDGTGAGNDVVVAAFKAAGAEVKLEVLPYARAKALAMEGELAGCFAMAWEPALEGRILFAREPLYSVRAVFFENIENPLRATSLQDFPEKSSLGVVTGYEYPAEIYVLKAHGVIFEDSTSEVINLKHLAAGQISSAVLVLDSLKNEKFVLEQARVKGQVRRAFEAGGQGSYVGFSLKHPMGEKAKEVFDRGFSIIKANGTYQEILDQWQKRMATETRGAQ